MLLFLVFVVTFTVMAGSVAIGSAAILARRRAELPPPTPPLALPPAERTAMTLRVRDAVSWMGESWIIEGRITYTELGRRWFAYRLVDGDQERWLRAEERDGVVLHLVQEEPALRFDAAPGEQLVYDEHTWSLARRGEVDVEHQGRTWRESVRRGEYFVYRGPGDRALFVERADEGFQGQVGRRVEERQLELFPGDLVKHAGEP